MKLNLGCGDLRIPGYVGVDFLPGPAVDVPFDLTDHPWNFAGIRPGQVDEIIAWHFLEHLPGNELDAAMREIARLLRPGGMLRVRVPYGLRSLTNPHHHHAFDRRTFNAWVVGRAGGTSHQAVPLFRRERQEVVRKWGFPAYHLKKYAPSLSKPLFHPDEIAGEIFLLPLIGARELREWLVRV